VLDFLDKKGANERILKNKLSRDMIETRKQMKMKFEEAKRLKKWEINLISSAVTTNRNYGFGEIDVSATFKGKKPPKGKTGSRY